MSIEDERAAWLAFKAADPLAVHECNGVVSDGAHLVCPVCRQVPTLVVHDVRGLVGLNITSPPPDPWPGQVWKPLDGGDPWMVQGFLDGVPWRWRFQQFRYGESFEYDTIADWPPKGCECLTTGWTP